LNDLLLAPLKAFTEAATATFYRILGNTHAWRGRILRKCARLGKPDSQKL